MFTGIVQSKAEVFAIKIQNQLMHLTIKCQVNELMGLEIGASVAINGVCLTAVTFSQLDNEHGTIEFDVIDETLRVTNLGAIKQGDFVNLERSLKAGDEIGGHMVSGHIHCQAIVVNIEKTPENCAITFEIGKEWQEYLFSKGFISINGCSLTLGAVAENCFTVHLIPETLSRTNIGLLQVNDKVNIECDQQTMTIVETVKKLKLK
ncbi:riboflavin synthase subunit alpha [Thalassotalea sp. LPB0316]|uniref:riboflavin synthase subunit alpha n=1 Tax=Thalassotalea sp. LPB0316 TaxID=2769490 RepID=UPI001868F18B|nr:riboflavin synthase subunit alpha [Thalassotalea sp. LPB0316]QOL25070.1 riboflavin synthase subunit alpha [Thalassotalea sp. LPB0316]